MSFNTANRTSGTELENFSTPRYFMDFVFLGCSSTMLEMISGLSVIREDIVKALEDPSLCPISPDSSIRAVCRRDIHLPCLSLCCFGADFVFSAGTTGCEVFYFGCLAAMDVTSSFPFIEFQLFSENVRKRTGYPAA
jgi:hypothetical protein